MRKPSIIQTEVCSYFNADNTTHLVLHHCLNGVAFRHKCDEDGLYVYLSPEMHRYIHETAEGHAVLIHLKRVAQQAYERTHTRAEFIARYGKSYL